MDSENNNGENNKENPDFLKKFSLEVNTGEVEVGHKYPIYGMITKILSEAPGDVIVELNFSIKAHMAIFETDKIELLKGRSFEPGIFVSTVTTKDPGPITVHCDTVVFGKRQEFNA